MKKQIKFTNEGKKVIIIGALNSQETIVQEIFIIDGKEKPSGENFVVKSLHDKPAVSWKEANLIALNLQYEKLKKQFDTDISVLERKIRDKSSVLRHKFNSLSAVEKNVDSNPKVLSRVLDFLSGEITHVALDNYNGIEIREFDSAIEQKEDYDSSKIKLCTVFGKSDGSLEYRINTWSDGSGRDSTLIYPFKSYEEAKEKAKEMIVSKFDQYPSEDLIKKAKELGLKLDSEKVKAYYNKVNQGIKDNILRAEESIKQYKAKIIKIK